MSANCHDRLANKIDSTHACIEVLLLFHLWYLQICRCVEAPSSAIERNFLKSSTFGFI